VQTQVVFLPPFFVKDKLKHHLSFFVAPLMLAMLIPMYQFFFCIEFIKEEFGVLENGTLPNVLVL